MNLILVIALFTLAGALLLVAGLLICRPGGVATAERFVHDVRSWSRWVVAKRISLIAAITLVLNILLSWHLKYVTEAFSNYVVTWMNRGVDLLAVVIAIPAVQRATTPADPALRPKDKYGNELVSALTVGPHPGVEAIANDAATALSAAAEILNPPTAPAETPPAAVEADPAPIATPTTVVAPTA